MIPQQQLLTARLAQAGSFIRETPIIRLDDDSVDLYAKLEFLNGVGSIKDRPAYWILKRAIERGEIGPSTTIVESSSGNFARALATFCRMIGLKFIPVIDQFVSPVYESVLRTLCREVIKVDASDDTGGYLKTRLRTVETLLSQLDDAYWPNQYGNPDGMAAHYHLTGDEICRGLRQIDYVFIGVSSAGTVAGVSRRLKEHNARIRVIAVDVEGSVIFGQPPKRRCIPGLGSSVRPSLLEQAIIDDVAIVTEAETIAGCHQLLNRYGLFVGGSTGAVYSAIQRYFSLKRGARPRVLFFCCDRGTAYFNNIFREDLSARYAAETAGTLEAVAADYE